MALKPNPKSYVEEYEEQEEFWPALDTSMEEDLPTFWGGRWGCASGCGPLRAVLMRQPGVEIENMGDPRRWRFAEAMDLNSPRAQRETHWHRSTATQARLSTTLRRCVRIGRTPCSCATTCS